MNNFYLTAELVNQHIQELNDQAIRSRNARRSRTSTRWLRRRHRHRPQYDAVADGGRT